jgi:hypothetical protein
MKNVDDFTEQIKIFRDDYVSVVIYRNITNGKMYYDIVPYRLIWERQHGGEKKRKWKRGTNFKPGDCLKLAGLLVEADMLLNNPEELNRLSGADADVKAWA